MTRPTTSLGIPESILKLTPSITPHSAHLEAQRNIQTQFAPTPTSPVSNISASNVLTNLMENFKSHAPSNYITPQTASHMQQMIQTPQVASSSQHALLPNIPTKSGRGGLSPPMSVDKFYLAPGLSMTSPGMFEHQVDVGHETILGMPPWHNQMPDLCESVDLSAVNYDDIDNFFITVANLIGGCKIYKDNVPLKEARHGTMLVPKDDPLLGRRRGNMPYSALRPLDEATVRERREKFRALSRKFAPIPPPPTITQPHHIQQPSQNSMPTQQYSATIPQQNGIQTPTLSHFNAPTLVAGQVGSLLKHYASPNSQQSFQQQPQNFQNQAIHSQQLQHQQNLSNGHLTPMSADSLTATQLPSVSAEQIVRQKLAEREEERRENDQASRHNKNKTSIVSCIDTSQKEDDDSDDSSSYSSSSEEEEEDCDEEISEEEKEDDNNSKRFRDHRDKQKHTSSSSLSSKKPQIPHHSIESLKGGKNNLALQKRSSNGGGDLVRRPSMFDRLDDDDAFSPVAMFEHARLDKKRRMLNEYDRLLVHCKGANISSPYIFDRSEMEKLDNIDIENKLQNLNDDVSFEDGWRKILHGSRWGSSAIKFVNSVVCNSFLDLEDRTKGEDDDSDEDDDDDTSSRKRKKKRTNSRPFTEAMDSAIAQRKFQVRRIWEANGKSFDWLGSGFDILSSMVFETVDVHISRTDNIRPLSSQSMGDFTPATTQFVANGYGDDTALQNTMTVRSQKKYVDYERRKREEEVVEEEEGGRKRQPSHRTRSGDDAKERSETQKRYESTTTSSRVNSSSNFGSSDNSNQQSSSTFGPTASSSNDVGARDDNSRMEDSRHQQSHTSRPLVSSSSTNSEQESKTSSSSVSNGSESLPTQSNQQRLYNLNDRAARRRLGLLK